MAAPYSPAVKGEDFQIRIGLRDASDPRSFKSSPTLAAGDFKVDKDGAGLNNLATLPTVSPAASIDVLIPLSATEMTADLVTINCIDQTSPKEWNDFQLCIITQSPVLEQGYCEGTITLKQALNLMLAVLTGKSSGGGTTTVVFRDTDDTKNRISSTVDANGNRTAVGTRDGS